MNGIEHIVRELGRQRARNAYYRDCYALFKLVQDLTEQTSNELKSIYTSDGDLPAYAVHRILWQYQNQVSSLIEQACEAQATCEELCPVDRIFSAREVLEPIRRLYNDANAAALGRHAIRDKKDQVGARLAEASKSDGG
ncbi:hypothetical protein N7520_001712 [Penicillium odoratum]|uniref:uncharacterized protein n=1 Tax=Penicillium odoratum TaxID=1167516 RepID=UPI002547962C|nr:uncharacterized protein N7520_001712 [Penicillium odoratum]KAJ5778466.1 hypothetical protein N7520_001712 [Penicillium odoratum]